MEAVPRLPMISFELRQPDEPVEFGRKLKQYIKHHYHESPEQFADDIKQLEGLRSSAVYPSRDIVGCSNMKRYYCQLHALSGRFPLMKDGAAAVRFSWKNLNQCGSTHMADVAFELSAILYNIGALHTQLGAEDSRTTLEGMKLACTHFQCAAWAFQHLGEEYASSSGMDLTLDFLNFLTNVSLGQAQECILEKSMLDNRKASIIAKVTVHTIEYYKQALKVITDEAEEYIMLDTVGARLCGRWENYLRFKILYLASIAYLFQGQQAEEQQKMGERVAFYQASFERLEEARKFSRILDNARAVSEALTFVHDVVEGKRKAAKNENEFIYHEEVPDFNLLPTIQGASLVKGIPFNIDDPDVSGPDIFAKIVPMKVHESASLYSEEKAQLSRKVVGSLESKNEELETFLSTLQLDDLYRTNRNQIPQELIDKCCAYHAREDPCRTVIVNMNTLSETFQEVEAMLEEIKKLLQEESSREQDYQCKVGKRPPSNVTTEMAREARKYEEAQRKAAESNCHLNKVFLKHLPYLKMLLRPLRDILHDLPVVDESPQTQAIVKDMQQILEKVNEMKKQRSMLKEKFRESMCQDDIVKKLVNHNSENLKTLFKNELQKHQPIISLIEQNLAAQDNIIAAVKEAYVRYGTTRRDVTVKQRKRDGIIAALIAAQDAYDDLLAMTSKGVDFYKKLHVNVGRLMLRLRGTCVVHDEERQQIMKNLKGFENESTDFKPPLKLKDYLDMKRDFGNLDMGTMYENPYLKQCEDSLRETYFPEIKPNEEDENFYLAWYPVKDQTWTNVHNSVSESDKPKSPAPSSPKATDGKSPTESAPQSLSQDIYPISAYSSVMPNASTTGYTGPKSNYYNTGNSPSRYINPPNFYADNNQPAVTSSVPAQPSGNSSYSQQKSVIEDDSSVPTTYALGSHPSQPVSSGYISTTSSSAQPDSVCNASLNTSQTGNYQNSSNSNDNNSKPVSPVNSTQSTPIHYRTFNLEDVDRFSVCQHDYTQYAQYFRLGNLSKTSGLPVVLRNEPAAPLECSFRNLTFPREFDIEHFTMWIGQPPPTHFVQPFYRVGDLLKKQPVNTLSIAQNQYSCGVNSVPTQDNEINTNADWTYVPPWNQLYNTSDELPNLSSVNPNTNVSMAYSVNPNDNVPMAHSVNPNTNVSMPHSVNLNTNVPMSTSINPNADASMAHSVNPNANLPMGFTVDPNTNVLMAHSVNPGTNVPMAHSNNPSQSFQSGNESLYTACQTNNYSLTSSEVYKNVDCQNQTAYENQYYVNQYGSSNGQNQYGINHGNSATYMQAGTDKQQATTTTTYSSNDSKSSPVSDHSNIDLLAGLDFDIGQSPLVPETPAKSDNSGVSVKTEKASQREKDKPVQETSNLNIKKETSQDVSVAKESCIDLEKLNQDVEKYEKFVESLTLKTLNGPTCLDVKWKEISDLQDKSNHLHIVSVARCYPMKNRFPDILPYDDSRIELPSTKDDYINASLVKNLSSHSPNFILTQAPLPSTYGDFWAMVFEYQVEVIVCLLNDAELDEQIYFPKEKGQELEFGKLKITLQSTNSRPNCQERIMSVCAAETRATKVVVHLQFTSWPGSSFPESPGLFLSFASECINFFNQQRSSSHPIVVHCTSGVGRSGLFCLIVTAIQEIQAGKGIPDLVAVTGQMSQYRKSPLRDREHLKFAYQAILYYCQDLLMKRGFLTNRSVFDERKLKEGICHTRHPSEDFLLGPPTDVSQLQSGIEKFGFECSGNKTESENGVDMSQSACGKQDSVTNSCTSSGKTSPSSLPSDALLSLDPANFSLKMDDYKGKKKAKHRYSTESFAKKSDMSLEGYNTQSEDPLSRLDPLWNLKK